MAVRSSLYGLRVTKQATMHRLSLVIAAAGLLVLAASEARAEHFDITMTLKTSKGTGNSGWDTSPPEGGFKPREVVSASAGEEVLLEWQCRSEFPHGVMKDVT